MDKFSSDEELDNAKGSMKLSEADRKTHKMWSKFGKNHFFLLSLVIFLLTDLLEKEKCYMDSQRATKSQRNGPLKSTNPPKKSEGFMHSLFKILGCGNN